MSADVIEWTPEGRTLPDGRQLVPFTSDGQHWLLLTSGGRLIRPLLHEVVDYDRTRKSYAERATLNSELRVQLAGTRASTPYARD